MHTPESTSNSLQSYGRIAMRLMFAFVAAAILLTIFPGSPSWIPLTIGILAVAAAVAGIPVLQRYRVATQDATDMLQDRRKQRQKAARYLAASMLVMAGMGVFFIDHA